MEPSTKQNPYMHMRASRKLEILIARPAIEIQPDGEERRFILQTESHQFPNVRRTGRQGGSYSTTRRNDHLRALSNLDFHEKYEVRIPERSSGLEYFGCEARTARGYFAGYVLKIGQRLAKSRARSDRTLAIID